MKHIYLHSNYPHLLATFTYHNNYPHLLTTPGIMYVLNELVFLTSTGVTSTRLKLFLEDNLLTKVEEEVFLPLMERMLDGWGELDLEGKTSSLYQCL